MSITPHKTTIAVAMSGGIDSSVTASLLCEQGFTVIGITMNVVPDYITAEFGVSSTRTVKDAQSVANQLGITHHVLDLSDHFETEIIEPFCNEYISGRTPNPCIHCNRMIKFSRLLEFGRSLGASYLATGHYVRIDHGPPCRLKKGLDGKKDQSYFLSRLTIDQLRQIITPLGTYTKKRVREMAHDLGLVISKKPESQEICFLPDGAYAQFVEYKQPDNCMPGPIKTADGTVVGTHKGLPHYTIGQRRNLGVALGKPQYVTAIDAQNNTLYIGDDDQLQATGVEADSPHWIIPPDSWSSSRLAARIRYRHDESPGEVVHYDDERVRFRFDEPQRAITPGQQLVLYRDDEVVGSATISGAFEE